MQKPTMNPLDFSSERSSSPSLRGVTHFDRLEEFRLDHSLTDHALEEMKSEFVVQMHNGLDKSRPPSSLKMLRTHIKSLPTGEECGVCYGLDWGGTNFRVLRYEFCSGTPPLEYCHGFSLSEVCDGRLPRDECFDFLCGQIRWAMMQNGDLDNAKCSRIPFGFTFSFPIEQSGLAQGVALEWNKGVFVPDVLGCDIVGIMQDAFNRNGIPGEICALLNDTVGTLLACAFENPGTSRIGVIVGTGTNACYVESEEDDEIINIEWGAFAATDELETAIDLALFAETKCHGNDKLLKMTSGKYLGEYVRLAALFIFEERFSSCPNARFLVPFEFESKHVSEVLAASCDEVLIRIFRDVFGISWVTAVDCHSFQEICRVVMNRSADLIGVCLAAVLEKCAGGSRVVTVGVDGSVYQQTPGYKERVKETLARFLMLDVEVQMKYVENGSGKGAALSVASMIQK